jgi:hypothetical protein
MMKTVVCEAKATWMLTADKEAAIPACSFGDHAHSSAITSS